MRKDINIDDFLEDRYYDSNHEITSNVEIEQKKTGWFTYIDVSPYQRERELSKMATHRYINFCKRFNLQYIEDTKSVFTEPFKRFRETHRYEKITSTVRFTVPGKKATHILHSLCESTYLPVIEKNKEKSKGWYERINRTGMPAVFADKIFDLWTKDGNPLVIFFRFYDFMYQYDHVKHITYYYDISFEYWNIDRPVYFGLTYKEFGFDSFTSNEQIYGMTAAFLEKFIERIKKEPFFIDVTLDEIYESGRYRYFFRVLDERHPKPESSVTLKQW